MAAKRLGFSDLYAAMNDNAPEEFKNGFRDGAAWPLRPFVQFVVPLCAAVRNQNEFETIQILREQSPRLASDNIAVGVVSDLLLELRRITQRLAAMMEPGAGASIGEVLRFLHDSAVIQLDSRILAHLNLRAERDRENATDADDDVTKEVSAMAALLACDASQFWGYIRFLSDESPFSTQQGVKGAEFERVLVVLDDEEGKHNQFSYEKYFGLRELSDTDKRNSEEGKDTVVARTRRLFYVCCTRALKDLVVVFFAADAVRAHDRIASLGLFPPDSIFREDVLSRF
jgi:DNA helicase-2/ATP-dependent DNA helicase PcrA